MCGDLKRFRQQGHNLRFYNSEEIQIKDEKKGRVDDNAIRGMKWYI